MPRSASRSVLGPLSPQGFLRAYWQKEPLVVRGAFPGLKDPLTPDELAGLSCEAEVDSRLVRQRGGRKPWQVVRGPQRPEILRRLPRSHWSLLVESVDRHSPGVAALAAAFSFLPRWRMDDVMVSLAPNHGTVGAHIDSYDVFLVQGQGRRRWEVDRTARPQYKPGLDLRILKSFRSAESWVLDPGDMLYVPPGIAHRGVTVRSGAEVAITYSVGFRAPSSADLLSSVLKQTLALDSPQLFSDRDRRVCNDSGELSKGDLRALQSFLIADMDARGGDHWILAAGEAVTAGGTTQTPFDRLMRGRVAGDLALGAALRPAPGVRLAWSRLGKGRAALFAGGESRVLSRDQAFAAPLICGQVSRSASRRVAANPPLLTLVLGLLRRGVVVLNHEAGGRRKSRGITS